MPAVAGLVWGTTRLLLDNHLRQYALDQARTKESIDALSMRMEASEVRGDAARREMHQQNSERFDKIDASFARIDAGNRKVLISIIGGMGAILAFLIVHFVIKPSW